MPVRSACWLAGWLAGLSTTTTGIDASGDAQQPQIDYGSAIASQSKARTDTPLIFVYLHNEKANDARHSRDAILRAATVVTRLTPSETTFIYQANAVKKEGKNHDGRKEEIKRCAVKCLWFPLFSFRWTTKASKCLTHKASIHSVSWNRSFQAATCSNSFAYTHEFLWQLVYLFISLKDRVDYSDCSESELSRFVKNIPPLKLTFLLSKKDLETISFTKRHCHEGLSEQ